MASKIYTVTVATGSSYGGGTGNVFYLDGVRNATGPGTVEWVAGATIRFNQSDGTNDNHPLIFSTNTSTSGIISSNVTYYLDGASNQTNYTNTTTFNAATVRYVEITPQSQTDFYYLCYVHGIGMGGIMDMVQNVWGALPWGDNAWQSLTSNISPTGQALSLSLGNLDAVFPSSGWGGESWSEGQWGSVGTGEQSVTGQAMSMSLGSVTGQSTTGWGRSTWGSEAWNTYAQAVGLGQAMSMAVSTQILIETEINAGWGRLGWNVNAWGVRGQVGAVGQAMTMSLANVDIDNQVNIGWGSDGWSVEAWGASIIVVPLSNTNLSLTLAEGSAGLAFDGDANVTPSGRAMTTATGSLEAFASFTQTVTGLPIGISLTFDIAVIPSSGISMSAALGTAIGDNITIAEVNAFSVGYWGYKSAWGNFAWGNGQTNTLVMSMLENFSGADPAPDAEVTGQAMAIALAAGDTFNISGDANIAPLAAMHWGDGTWGESTWNDGLYRPDTDDIFPMTLSLGTAVLEAVTTPTITGLGVQQVRLGTINALADANVIPTGLGLTFSVGTGTNALIWNDVPTGSAPVTPPGWQEVPTNAA